MFKKILLILLLASSLYSEILVIYEVNSVRKNSPKISFDDNKVTMTYETNSFFTTTEKISSMTYEEFLTDSCKGRKYKLISASFGVRHRDNFVIDCLDKELKIGSN